MQRVNKLTVVATVLVLVVKTAQASSVVWTQLSGGNASGSWNTAANPPWNTGGLPGPADTADFSIQDITADSTVTLDADQSINSLIFGDTVTSSAAGWTISSGTPATSKLILNGVTPTITVNALGTGKSVTISAVIDGTSGLTKAGVGTLILSGANTYSNTTINAGTLKLNSGVAMKGGLTINNGGTLAFGTFNLFGEAGTVPVVVNTGAVVDSSATVTTFKDLTLAGGNLLGKGGFNAQWGSFVLGGTLNVISNSAIRMVSGNFNGIGSGAHTGNRTLVINVSSGVTLTEELSIWDSPIDSGTSTNIYTIIMSGPGTAVFGASNTYSGGTTISNGFIAVSNNMALSTGMVTLKGGGLSTAGGSWIITNVINLATNAIIDTAGNNLALAGVITNSGSLVKTGTGTLTLSATNTYSGATIISNGVLSLAHELCLSTNTDVYLYTGATNNLNFFGTNVIHGLYINNVFQCLEVYGAAHRSLMFTGQGYLKPLFGAPQAGTIMAVR